MKIKLGARQVFSPSPIALVGTLLDGKPNFTTVGDVAIMGVNPPLIYISLHTKFCSTAGIRQTPVFSVNMPSTDLLAQTDLCGMESGWKYDKVDLFTLFSGETGAPLIEECPLNLDCRVVAEFAVQHRQGYIGEIVQAYADERILSLEDPSRPVVDTARLDPIFYGLNNVYYRLGERIGTGYHEGKKLRGEAA